MSSSCRKDRMVSDDFVVQRHQFDCEGSDGASQTDKVNTLTAHSPSRGVTSMLALH